MKHWFHSWRAAIRIARRDALRSKGRSFLVLAMIALPIIGVSAADLTLRSAELSTEQTLERSIGAADARLSGAGVGGVAIHQTPDASQHVPVENYDDKPWPEGPTDLKQAIPAGAKSLESTTGSAKLRTTHGLLHTEVRELKATDPMAAGLMTLLSGRFPQGAGEVAATTHFLESSGLSIGSKISARGLDREYTITGAYEVAEALEADEVNALPGALLDPLDKALVAGGLPGVGASTSYLVSVPGGFTWNMVKQANTNGVVVVSRAVQLNPPARSDVPIYDSPNWAGGFEQSTAAKAAALASAATVVGLAMLEICLLAGPAFAVGARRSRRQLGLVGANGGDRRHIRAIVLSGGLVIGIAAAVVGTLLGLALTFALRPLLEEAMGARFGHFDIRPLELLGIALLAVITGLLAAIVPAVTASRQTVLASLTGRRGIRRSNRVLPLLGLGGLLLGAAIALYGSVFSDQFLFVAGGSALAELGVVAMTPALVGLFGRVGRWLPLSPRLALRDAVRNRGRTAPAVAAVLAAVAGTVAVTTFQVSSDAQSEAAYVAQLPAGGVSLLLDEPGGRDVAQAREAVQKYLPVEDRADVDRITVGKEQCTKYSDNPGCGSHEIVVPKANECPLWADAGPDVEDPAARFTKAQRRELAADWRCRDDNGYEAYVGDEKLLKVLGIDDPAAAKALAEGKVVSFDKHNIDTAKGNTVGIRLITEAERNKADAARTEPVGTVKTFTAHQVSGKAKAYGVSLLIPPSAAKSAGLLTVPYGTYYTTQQAPSSEQRQKLDGELDKMGAEIELHIEEGYVSDQDITLLALSLFAGLITIGAAGIATGLAQADAEADLKTLAAVGAPPRVRRTLSGFQCGVVAVMGVVLGTAAGVLPAIGLRLNERRSAELWYQKALDEGYGRIDDLPYVPIVVPWGTLAALLIAVPVGAAVLAALVTRSKGALARREAT
ncbi:FtsX-like permease family protein [Streptomyces sp. NPDC127084]|uniref:FtsX-like permease family protein n=1 Tax=Streptomyces sp. NPDC127084 TaxID=3347133 RepID=UPI003661723E